MAPVSILQGKRIVLGVTGSIACYKAADLASKLTQVGALVDIIMTDAAQEFVAPLTFRAVTGRAVYTNLWGTDNSGELPTHIAHVGLGEGADLLVIAPATAHHIAKLANGLADDILSVTVLSARCPLVIAPAMDGAMYSNPATVENLQRLRNRGATVIEPEVGHMASGLVAQGRLPEVPVLLGLIRQQIALQNGALVGRKIVVTAGGTQEPIDPVRYITNRSSGKQGYAIAQAALDAGAQVTLITTPTGLPNPVGSKVVTVESAQSMLEAVMQYTVTQCADALVMAAAVADFRPALVADQKIKKTGSGLTIELTANTDILYTVGQQRGESGYPRVLIGFAAETQDLLNNAQSKLTRKNADYIVANDVSREGSGFQGDTNIVTILGADGTHDALPQQSKEDVAHAIVERIVVKLNSLKS